MKLHSLILLILMGSCHSDLQSNLKGDLEPREPVRTPLKTCQSYCAPIMEQNSLNPHVTLKDHLSFPNYGFRGIGQCRGHALVTQRFIMLAHFRPDLETCVTDDLLTKECYREVKDAIDSIMEYKYTVIKGFHNLYEFSSHPTIRRLLKYKIQSIPARYRANYGDFEEQYDNRNVTTFYELIRRVNIGHRPYVAIHGVHTIGAHGLIAREHIFENGQDLLCMTDPNIILEDGVKQNCQNYAFEKEGVIYYKQYKKEAVPMRQFHHFSDEDRRTSRYVHHHYLKCLKQSRAYGNCK
jgi:hypothetical protein